MILDPHAVECASPLLPLDQRALAPGIRLYRAAYHRQIPTHYRENPLTRQQVEINVLLAEGGRLVVPRSPRTSFVNFYRQLGQENPALLRRIISPTGTAKSAADSLVTPIKEITGMRLSGFGLPGDEEMYGWGALQEEAAGQGLRLALLFQGNGLYYNRGSVLFDGEQLLAYPDSLLCDLLESGLPPHSGVQLAVTRGSLQRNMLFFTVRADGGMEPYLHCFSPGETYRQGMVRLRETFRSRGVRCALAASPPLIIPGQQNEPVYLSLEEILRGYHANDVRHTLYCPYEGAVLLSAELGRAQCLQPAQLAASIEAHGAHPLCLTVTETLGYYGVHELGDILERKGYGGRFSIQQVDGKVELAILPLEGVYSHLLPFLTRGGMFGLIQTSGTRGNITGNDGPTLRQLSAILRDLNQQPPFTADPIIAASSGSQGNDVPNVVCRSAEGAPGLLAELAPQAALDDRLHPRGIVTTPRVGIAIRH
jgi:hypothetical protein